MELGDEVPDPMQAMTIADVRDGFNKGASVWSEGLDEILNVFGPLVPQGHYKKWLTEKGLDSKSVFEREYMTEATAPPDDPIADLKRWEVMQSARRAGKSTLQADLIRAAREAKLRREAEERAECERESASSDGWGTW